MKTIRDVAEQAAVGAVAIVADAASERIRELESALRTCIARAGAPDPAEACRLVIRTAEEALRGRPKE